MVNATVQRSTLVPLLLQDCLQRQEIAQLYKALAKHAPCPEKQALYRALASSTEVGLLRPARRLKRLGESVPCFRQSWGYWIKQWYLCQVKGETAIAWLHELEERTTKRYLEIIPVSAPNRTRGHDHPVGGHHATLTCHDLLCPRSRYYGDLAPEKVDFNGVLQDFANRVSLTCALETGGKISQTEAMERLDALWQALQTTRMRHRLTQDVPHIPSE